MKSDLVAEGDPDWVFEHCNKSLRLPRGVNVPARRGVDHVDSRERNLVIREQVTF
jgi:hypothetical protein